MLSLFTLFIAAKVGRHSIMDNVLQLGEMADLEVLNFG
jgi:hypothetical protein